MVGIILLQLSFQLKTLLLMQSVKRTYSTQTKQTHFIDIEVTVCKLPLPKLLLQLTGQLSSKLLKYNSISYRQLVPMNCCQNSHVPIGIHSSTISKIHKSFIIYLHFLQGRRGHLGHGTFWEIIVFGVCVTFLLCDGLQNCRIWDYRPSF